MHEWEDPLGEESEQEKKRWELEGGTPNYHSIVL